MFVYYNNFSMKNDIFIVFALISLINVFIFQLQLNLNIIKSNESSKVF